MAHGIYLTANLHANPSEPHQASYTNLISTNINNWQSNVHDSVQR